MVVAGEQTNNLKKHLEKNGAFTVDFAFKSFHSSKAEINNSIIKVDKLLFIYRPQEMQIRDEMTILRDLLTKESFFEVSEILFVQKKDNNAKAAEDYFNAVMIACRKAKQGSSIDYSLNTIDSELTFQNINNLLLGKTQSDNSKNTIDKFFRYEKGNNAKSAYVPKNTKASKIEAFSFMDVNDYEEQKEISLKIETGYSKETKEEDDLSKYDAPEFGELATNDLDNTRWHIICGSQLSGKSTWAKAFIASSKSVGKRIIVVDITNHKKLKMVKDLEISLGDIKSLVENKVKISNSCTIFNADIRKDAEPLLKILLSKDLSYSRIDDVIVVCDLKDIEKIYLMLKFSVNTVFFCTQASETYVNDIKGIGEKIVASTDVFLLINTQIEVENPKEAEEIKAMVSPDIKVVKPIVIRNFGNLSGSLYTKLLGGAK
jgi:hypothetical protein